MKPYRLISFFLLAVLAACRPDDPVVPQEIQAPSGVKCVTATQTTLVFSWNEVDGADYYVARLEKAGGTLVSGGQTSTRETSIRYDGLTPETAYSFKVRVRADDMPKCFTSNAEMFFKNAEVFSKNVTMASANGCSDIFSK